MNKPYKRSGYNSVSPYLVIDGSERLIELLQQIFDAQELSRYQRSDGTIMHAEILIDDSVIMLGGATKDYQPNQHLLHVYVPDVDETFQKAVDAGCAPLRKPKERDTDPDRRGAFRDFAGNVWSVSTQVKARE